MLFYLIAVGHRAKKDKQNNNENKPLIVAKPTDLRNNKFQTITESNVESDLEKITLNDIIEPIVTPASG